MSRHGRHQRAVACLKQAWTVSLERDDAMLWQGRAALELGKALLRQARFQHQQAGYNLNGCDGRSAACADTLKEAQTRLRAVHDLSIMSGTEKLWIDAQMYLACAAFFHGDEDLKKWRHVAKGKETVE